MVPRALQEQEQPVRPGGSKKKKGLWRERQRREKRQERQRRSRKGRGGRGSREDGEEKIVKYALYVQGCRPDSDRVQYRSSSIEDMHSRLYS